MSNSDCKKERKRINYKYNVQKKKRISDTVPEKYLKNILLYKFR